MDKHINTTQAATELGVSRIRITQMITSGQLKAQKIGRDWIIAPRDLDKVRIRPKGRPPTKAKPISNPV